MENDRTSGSLTNTAATVAQGAVEFLIRHRMDYSLIDMTECAESFSAEMNAGLKGMASSLEMIPTYISPEKSVPRNEPVIVLDAGGTNFRTAVIHFEADGSPKIDEYRKFPMPGSGTAVSRDEFFSTISGYMSEIASASDRIGFCFSYPTENFPSGDGRLIQFTKEIQAPEVIGAMVGKSLKESLKKSGVPGEKKVTLLNDTVATLLAGKSGENEKNHSSYIGFILGTGTNYSYIEKNSRIEKITGLHPEHTQVINMESGGFMKAPGGSIDDEFDRGTNNPGTYRFEKMISGAYLGTLALTLTRKAAQEGLFTSAFAAAIHSFQKLDTKAMDDFLHNPRNSGNPFSGIITDERDRTVLFILLDRLVERAAKLSASALSAVVLETGKGINPTEPVLIMADGTTFYKTSKLKFRTEFYLKTFLEDRHGRFFEINGMENAPLVGAAVAGLIS